MDIKMSNFSDKKINDTKKTNLNKEDSVKKNSKSSFLKKALITEGLSLFNSDSDYSEISSSDNIIYVLESEYKDSLFNEKEDSDEQHSSSESSNKENNINNKEHINIKENNSHKTSSNNIKKKNSFLYKDYIPNKNKNKVNTKDLSEIINTLKGDYLLLDELSEAFQKYDFDSLNNVKSNKLLNDLENKVFNRYKSLNNIDKIINSNIELKETLNLIFKTEDITAQCLLHAYNIYSLIKMFHYNKNHNTYINSSKRSSSSSIDNNKNTKNSKFKKEQFDSLKSIRDEEIKILQTKNSNYTSTEEHSNLDMLKNESSIMEGYKSNLRLDTITKNRTQDLSDKIRDSKKSIDGSIFSAQLIASNYLKNFISSTSTNNKT